MEVTESVKAVAAVAPFSSLYRGCQLHRPGCASLQQCGVVSESIRMKLRSGFPMLLELSKSVLVGLVTSTPGRIPIAGK